MNNSIPTPELFNRFLENRSTAAELALLFTYFGTAEEAELRWLVLEALEYGGDNAQNAVYIAGDEESRLAVIHARLSDQIFGDAQEPVLRSVRTNWMVRAAAILVAVVAVGFLIHRLSGNGNQQVVPGGLKASLVVNGVAKNLRGQKSAVLYRDNGVTITTKADGSIVYAAYDADSLTASKMNSLETPKGGEYRVVLSDGSVVRLNAGSKLSFPTGFRGAERRVTLEGEGFFEVAKNPEVPFIVSVDDISIRVLGTKFNVSSYKEDNSVTATLLEGSILFSDHNNHQIKLAPNQQLSSQQGKLTLSHVEAADYAAWTKGDFLFNDMPIAAVLQKVGRWYNVEVDVQSLPDKNLYLKISRNANITDLLKMLSRATDVDFVLQDNKIRIKAIN